MAELNVERKKRHVWPWILGLLALALIIWAIAAKTDVDDEVAQSMPATTSNEAAPEATSNTAAQDAAATDNATASDDTPRR